MEDKIKLFFDKFWGLIFEDILDYEIKYPKENLLVLIVKDSEKNKKYLGRIIGKNKLNLKSISRTCLVWLKAQNPKINFHLDIENDRSRTTE